MKILYSHRIGSRDGQGVHLEAMVAALRAAGHTVQVVGPASFADTALGQDNRVVTLLRRMLPSWIGELAELAYVVPSTLRLSRAAAELKPDIIYERANLFHLAGAWVSARRGIPLLLEVNAPLAEERARFGQLKLRRIAGAIERLAWRRATRVLPVTDVLAQRIAEAGVPQSRISVVPNGIDLADFPKALSQGPSREEVVLGFVGFVRGWHGLDHVIRSLAHYSGKPKLTLQIVGDGPARGELEQLARELGVISQVQFTGLTHRQHIPELVRRFDIALQPAAVPYASPLKVFEYMAAARAIVAPDQPNLREILEHDRTALLFQPGDVNDMWGAVVRLAQDPGLRQRLGEAARAEVFSRDLTWEGNARRVLSLASALRGQASVSMRQAP